MKIQYGYHLKYEVIVKILSIELLDDDIFFMNRTQLKLLERMTVFVEYHIHDIILDMIDSI
jgi:hypothetical protein